MSNNKPKAPIEHVNIGEFNRGQSSKIIRGLVEDDKTAFVQKNGKPIAVIIFSLLSLCAFSIQNFDYSDRGVIPNSSYDWGIAYYIFYVATIVVFVGAIWMLVCKIKQKRRDKLESDT